MASGKSFCGRYLAVALYARERLTLTAVDEVMSWEADRLYSYLEERGYRWSEERQAWYSVEA